MKLSVSGRLGLGTSSPSTALHINSTNNFTIATTNQTNAANSYISFVDTGTTAGNVRCGSQGNDFVVNAGGNRVLTLAASGTATFGSRVTSNRSTDGYAFEADYNSSLRGGIYASSTGASLALKDSSGTTNVSLDGSNGSGSFAGGLVTLSSGSGYSSLALKNASHHYALGTVGNTNNLRLYSSTLSTTFSSWQTNGDFYHGGGTANGTDISSPNIRLNANGSATFVGGISVDFFSSDTTSGSFNFFKNKGATDAINSVWGTTGGQQNIKFYNDGDAEFAGDIETTTAATGVILKSPNGTRYRLTVADNGTLTTTAV